LAQTPKRESEERLSDNEGKTEGEMTEDITLFEEVALQEWAKNKVIANLAQIFLENDEEIRLLLDNG
jgi:hypothetical protein